MEINTIKGGENILFKFIMTEQTTMNIDAEESKQKISKDKKHILSYLTFLEKFYEKSKDNSHQERLFRINKAINSINKYSNCKVSSFNVNPSKTILKRDEKEFIIPQKNGDDSSEVEDILKLIEKELRQNGINEKDINDSLLSTSIKTINSPNDIELSEKQSFLNQNNEEFPKTNFNRKRLSKLFLKIELKLKTFLQENSGKDELKGENDKENSNDNKNNANTQNENKNISYENNLNKSPSKLPKVMDSFFSNKKKIDSILSKVRKQRRKSVMDFNVNYGNFPKEEKEKVYLQNSEGDENANKKRKKIIACSAQVKIRNKVKKKPTSEKISNFCDMIDENEENKEDFEGIKAFDTINESNNENNNNDVSNTINDSININNESSIKIVSSLNNKNNFNFDCSNVNVDSYKIEAKNNKEVQPEDNNNYHFVSKNSVFKNEIGNESKNAEGENNQYGSRLLDDEILIQSSDIKDVNSIKNDDKGSCISCSDSDSDSESNDGYDSKDNNSIGDERYNLLKYINDSKSRKDKISNNSEEEDEKFFSPFGENTFNKMKLKSSLQRDIARNNNINGFTMNSILSPIKAMDGKANTQCVIEEFSKFNS